MSKSLGNLVMVRDVLEAFSPDALRLYLGRHHYREAWAFDKAELGDAAEAADHLRRAVSLVGETGGESLSPRSAIRSFEDALDDDLQPAPAIEALISLANTILDAAEAGAKIDQAQETLRKLAGVFGLRLGDPAPEARVRAGWGEHLKRFESASNPQGA
jgi:cysteinyl-tRNA synthetase